jgi:hypothetical protein
MLGHASAAMTLEVYANLFDSDLDSVAESVAKNVATRGAIARLFAAKIAPICANASTESVPSVRFELTLDGF